MPPPLRAVFFDVDGVLVDSLPQHLQICRDKAAEFGLQLRIPSVAEFRMMVRSGIKVSPMRDFFLAVGFPAELADRAFADYDRDFMRLYRPKAFAGVEEMLSAVRRAGVKLGLVTSNTRANVTPALGSAMRYFEESSCFFFDPDSKPRSKASFLVEGARALDLDPGSCIYVGDQPADAAAAAEAGARFLGVTYGWGISQDDGQYETADSVAEIERKLVNNRP